ncbi:hypothetical protein [Francisella sp. SYW-9]|uniref:hypothetical protein n=1 Tax=Francisella sp. SYW-9 TaxID=2610888 RepID=UPI00123D80F9|nr:hypothetical protein [Francisella sp. SYW-9]
MFRLVPIIILLSSCSMLKPAKLLDKLLTTQSAKDLSTSQFQTMASVGLSARDTKTNQYRDSNIKSKDTETNHKLNIDDTKAQLNVGSKVVDKSSRKNNILTDTKTSTNDDKYMAKRDIYQNNQDDISALVVVIVSMILTMLILIFTYWLGGYIALKRIGKYLTKKGS